MQLFQTISKAHGLVLEPLKECIYVIGVFVLFQKVSIFLRNKEKTDLLVIISTMSAEPRRFSSYFVLANSMSQNTELATKNMPI